MTTRWFLALLISSMIQSPPQPPLSQPLMISLMSPYAWIGRLHRSLSLPPVELLGRVAVFIGFFFHLSLLCHRQTNSEWGWGTYHIGWRYRPPRYMWQYVSSIFLSTWPTSSRGLLGCKIPEVWNRKGLPMSKKCVPRDKLDWMMWIGRKHVMGLKMLATTRVWRKYVARIVADPCFLLTANGSSSGRIYCKNFFRINYRRRSGQMDSNDEKYGQLEPAGKR